MTNRPTVVEALLGDLELKIAVGDFGQFAQRMLDVGLVFNIEFTGEELGQLPRWELFDHKIMDSISSPTTKIKLPPRPTNTPPSVNTMLWSIVQCHKKSERKHTGLSSYHLNPPTHPITTMSYTLERLIQEKLVVGNPISNPDNTPVPQYLMIIGSSSLKQKTLNLTSNSSSV